MRLLRWYGAGPLHLLTMLGCLALGGYAAARLLPGNAIGVLVWLAGAVIGHDLLLLPLYTLADRSVMAIFRHRPPRPPAVPWINYLRVPVALSGMLLLIWFPLIFRLPTRFPATTTLPLGPYLWHWLAVTGALFLLSAGALALRLRPGRQARASEIPSTPPEHPSGPELAGGPAGPAPAAQPGTAPAGTVLPDAPEPDAPFPGGPFPGTPLPDAPLPDAPLPGAPPPGVPSGPTEADQVIDAPDDHPDDLEDGG